MSANNQGKPTIAITLPIVERASLTIWYASAGGYGERFQSEIANSLQRTAFPEMQVQAVLCKTPGGCLLGTSEQFDGIAMKTSAKDLREFRCVYKATEFGNILHVSYIIFSIEGCGSMLAKIPIINLFVGSKRTLKQIEYAEAFSNLVNMVLNDAVDHLGSDPVHRIGSASRSESPRSKSGLGELKK